MPQGQFVKLQCKADGKYNLAARSDGVVVAPADESDPRQQWYKDESWERLKDVKGQPCFTLINRATRQALTHPGGEGTQVVTSEYFGDSEDESVLWTLSEDVCSGWNALRPCQNFALNLSTSHWDKKHGDLTDGTDVVLSKWKSLDNQCWKLVPTRNSTEGADTFHHALRSENRAIQRSLNHLHRCKIISKAAGNGYSLSARDDGVVLAPTDDSDSRQQWIKDEWWGCKLIDMSNHPAFAVVNVASQHVLSHAVAEEEQVSLVKFVPNVLDGNVLWTSEQVGGDGWFSLRKANNIKLVLDAYRADKKHGGASDGTKAVIFKCSNQENQLWKFVPIA